MSYFSIPDLERYANSCIQKSLDSSYSTESVRLRERQEFINFSRFDESKRYDIFLSHSYQDKNAILGLAMKLKNEYKYKVYLDWIEDKTLDRSNVTRDTAKRLKERMTNCNCLFYAISNNSTSSKWMPWELGLMDGMKGKVAVCPLEDNNKSIPKGFEYLDLYPYVDEAPHKNSSKNVLWINENSNTYVSFDEWLRNAYSAW